MSPMRGAALVLGTGLLAAWLAAAAGPAQAPVRAPLPVAPPAVEVDDPLGLGPPPAERLADSLRHPPVPEPRRNPFAFATSPAPAAEPAESRAGSPPVAPAPVVSRPEPPLLVGVAEDAGADGPVRTAILRVDGELHFAVAGSDVTARYRVAAVGADAVELVDTASGDTFTLSLP